MFFSPFLLVINVIQKRNPKKRRMIPLVPHRPSKVVVAEEEAVVVPEEIENRLEDTKSLVTIRVVSENHLAAVKVVDAVVDSVAVVVEKAVEEVDSVEVQVDSVEAQVVSVEVPVVEELQAVVVDVADFHHVAEEALILALKTKTKRSRLMLRDMNVRQIF